jgi:hypothetical protein
VAHEHDVVEVAGLDVVDHGIDELGDADLGEVGGVVAPAREIDCEHVPVEEWQEPVPALLAEPPTVHQHHRHRVSPLLDLDLRHATDAVSSTARDDVPHA